MTSQCLDVCINDKTEYKHVVLQSYIWASLESWVRVGRLLFSDICIMTLNSLHKGYLMTGQIQLAGSAYAPD